MKTVFIVDDNTTNLIIAKKALSDSYKTFTLTSAEKMFQILDKINPDLIILDVEMPLMNGFEVLSILKKNKITRKIPVIFLTAKHDPESELRGFEMGAVDFINKPFSAPVLVKRVETHIEIDSLIKKSLRSVRQVHNATINIIASIVENRDKVTGGHIDRTQKLLAILVNEMIREGIYFDEISKWELEVLLPSAQLHDVGKIMLNDNVLNKPCELTDEEFDLIKEHCIEGERIIDGIIERAQEDGFLIHAKRFAGYHHEKWDGTGYPRGLSGEKIPLEARLMAIADVYDALVSERSYKKPLTHDEAVEMIKNESGTHFDPKIVEVFLNIANDFSENTSFDMEKLMDIYNEI